MVVTLKFLGSLRHVSGKENLTLECKKGVSIIDLVNEVSQNVPLLRRSLLNEHLDKPTPNALILVNGREISVLENLFTKVKDGDEIVFVPIVHGG